jgi:hypothetical protein
MAIGPLYRPLLDLAPDARVDVEAILRGLELTEAASRTRPDRVDRSRTEVTILRYCGSGMPLDELAAPAVTCCSDGAWKAAVRSDRTFDARGTLVWTNRSSSLETRMPAAFRGTLLDGNAIAYVSTVTDGQVKGCGAPAKAISLQVPAAW